MASPCGDSKIGASESGAEDEDRSVSLATIPSPTVPFYVWCANLSRRFWLRRHIGLRRPSSLRVGRAPAYRPWGRRRWTHRNATGRACLRPGTGGPRALASAPYVRIIW